MKALVFILSILSISNSYADITGVWIDNLGNYFSVQEKNGKVLLLDLSHSLPRANALKRAGIEPKPEELAYFGEVSVETFSAGSFQIPPLIELLDVYPQAFRFGLTDHDITFNVQSENQGEGALSIDPSWSSRLGLLLPINKVY